MGRKIIWYIETNQSHEMYLKNYGAMDRMDHLVQNAKLFYKNGKYWYAPMLYSKELSIFIEYSVYLELFKGEV